MGEEKKDEDKSENKEEVKKDEKSPDDPPVVLKVDMHCAGCARKVAKSLRDFKGVEEVQIDMMFNRVTVKGKADPLKLRERVQKKTGKKTELISPLPSKISDDKKPEDQNPEKKAELQKTKDEPPLVTVVLVVSMHCEGCAQAVKKNILKMKGVQTAEPDFKSQRVTVRGTMDPKKLVHHVYKRTGKHAHILTVQVEDVKKDTVEQKDGGENKEQEEKKEEGKQEGEKKEEEPKKEDEKKEEEPKKEDEKKEEGKNEEADKKEAEEKKDGEKKDGEEQKEGDQEKNSVKEKEEEKKEGDQESKANDEGKKNEYCAPMYVIEYVYPPQLFSDENPNACSIM